jgi:hypothetical protein
MEQFYRFQYSVYPTRLGTGQFKVTLFLNRFEATQRMLDRRRQGISLCQRAVGPDY